MLPLYLDEDVTERLVDALGMLGVDVLSANRNHKGLEDPDQLLVATDLARTFVTYNAGDYLLLHRAWVAWTARWDLRTAPEHPGILLLHSATGYNVERMAGIIYEFVRSFDHSNNLTNRAFAWNIARGWHEK
ncbi:MAG TPA: DUF5615 family PIN-like protein [Thermomicrobiales bacterium]|nr:DUF5615 family PIN-like protein [Thermomicrobiales bacterium]